MRGEGSRAKLCKNRWWGHWGGGGGGGGKGYIVGRMEYSMKYSHDSQRLAAIPFEYNVSTSAFIENLQPTPSPCTMCFCGGGYKCALTHAKRVELY